MDITWFGHFCFRLRDRDVCVVTDPFDASLGYTLPKVEADIVTVSRHHPYHSYLPAVKGDFRLLDSPGEYEIRSVFVIGIATYPPRQQTTNGNQADERSVVFVLEFDGLTVCHLGDLRQVPSQAQVEAFGEVDVLLVPVGDGDQGSLNAAQAAEVVSLIEPSIVIPMHYRTTATTVKLDGVDKFLKEMGVGRIEPVDSLRVTATSLPQPTQVVVLNPR